MTSLSESIYICISFYSQTDMLWGLCVVDAAPRYRISQSMRPFINTMNGFMFYISTPGSTPRPLQVVALDKFQQWVVFRKQ